MNFKLAQRSDESKQERSDESKQNILQHVVNRKGVMRVNKIFYSMLHTVLPDCDLYKSKLHNKEIAQVTAYFFIKHISHCLPQKHLQ